MTSLASTIATDIRPIRHSSIPAKVGLALALAALADWLFYGERIGLSLTLFAVAMACVSVLFNHAVLDFRRAAIGGTIFMLGLMPAVEELNTLWQSAPADGYSAERMLHRLVDTHAFGSP